MTITPDDKDWTWVLTQPCAECGFDAATVTGPQVAGRLRAELPLWHAVLSAGQAEVRPDPETWSPLEYAAHVRDVCTIFTTRLDLMLTQDDPMFANWDQDATAVEQDYGSQDPAVVSAEFVAAAGVLADQFDAVEGEQWSRTGRRSDGAVFTVDTFSRYFLHDIVHHGADLMAH